MSDFATLSGRRAVVTGASSGIGRAIALELARAGAELRLHYRSNEAGANEVAERIRRSGGTATLRQADLARPAELESFVESAFEDGPVDVWVNNAGADVLTGAAADLDYADKLERLLDTDLRATMLLSRLAGRRMQDRGGVILNVGWDQAATGMEGDSGELFAATKNAIMGFTRSLALSLAPAVRVNCIAPGWIRTSWGEQASDYWQDRVRRETPLERWGTPEDIAAMARFLASEEAGFLTGQVINVNGGVVR